MPGGGSKVTPVKLGPLQERIEEYLAKRNDIAWLEPWTVSDFIRIAVAEKLKHIARSNKKKPTEAQVQPGPVLGDGTQTPF